MPLRGRALGVDLGKRRIGIAISDSDQKLASALEVIQRIDPQKDYRKILSIVQEWEVVLVVIGLPLSLSGDHGTAAQEAIQEIQMLRELLKVEVVAQDERLSTVSAQRALTQANINAKNQRHIIDKVAASIILQAYLDFKSQSNNLT